MRQQKPILHGHDHLCGGADPIPALCALIGPGGQFVSRQTAPSVTPLDGLGSSFGISNMDPERIYVTDIGEHLADGYSLYGQFVSTVMRIDGMQMSGDYGSTFTFYPSAFSTATRLTGTGTLLAPGDESGMSPHTWGHWALSFWSAHGGVATITDTVFTLDWLWADDTPPNLPGVVYPGAYPITDGDVASAAGIQASKLRPSTTTNQVLTTVSGATAWAAPQLEVEY